MRRKKSRPETENAQQGPKVMRKERSTPWPVPDGASWEMQYADTEVGGLIIAMQAKKKERNPAKSNQ